MKNINAYMDAVMVGNRWVATPFVINYGLRNEEGYVDDYIEWDIDNQVYINYFDGMKKKDMCNLIMQYANPKYYGVSFFCGDMGYAKYGAPNKEYNTIQILFDVDKCCIKIAGIWLDKTTIPKTKDYSLIGKVSFIGNKKNFCKYVKHDILITCDLMLFKYTMNMWEDFMYLRFDKTFGDSLQYNGILRFDEGKDVDTGKFESFSIIKSTILLEEDYAISCKNKLKLVNDLSMYE